MRETPASPASPSSFTIERGRSLDRLTRIVRWFDTPRPTQLGTDYSVRRYVEHPFANAQRALVTVSADHRVGASDGGTDAVVRTPASWLSFASPEGASPAQDQLRLTGVLHAHRFGRPLRVEVVVEPWSSARTELRMQLRSRRGKLKLPQRYFDAAHPVMIALRDEIEAHAAA
jgi:hypothetical protein